MSVADRTPSTAWELVSLAEAPGVALWAWYGPAGMPAAVCVRFPAERPPTAFQQQPVTIRNVVRALGLAEPEALGWSLYGIPTDAQQGRNPAWDLPIPPPGPGVDPTITLFLRTPVGLGAVTIPPVAAAAASVGHNAFSRIETEWNASLQLEMQLDSTAKQLNATLLRLNSLNRDLSPEEFRSADQQERREWQDARRWLRDVAARVSRFLKEHHVGMTSAAGKRNAFETLYRDSVVPRRPIDGLAQSEREFEAYRKSLQSLLSNMQSALASALQDGERRAQQVLTRITARVRAARAKR